jgi:hypothetical protein
MIDLIEREYAVPIEVKHPPKSLLIKINSIKTSNFAPFFFSTGNRALQWPLSSLLPINRDTLLQSQLEQLLTVDGSVS